MRYDSNNICSLKEYVYNSNMHDAEIKILDYDWSKKNISLTLRNSFYREAYTIEVESVQAFVFTRGDWGGSSFILSSLTVDNPDDQVTKLIMNKEHPEDVVYLCFQMFSGDEVQIAAKAISINWSNV